MPLAWKYGLAIVAVTSALLVTQSLQPTVFPTPLFFAAIVISTWFGGTGPGLFAVLLATVVLDYYFVSPDRTLSVSPAAVLYLAQFSLPAMLSSWFVKKRKDAEAALKEARDQLDVKVQLRTAELRRTNEQLAHLNRVTTMSALATSIAHEVNQPLAAIVTTGDACLRWLAAEPPNVERARDSVSRIVNEGNRAGEVIRRIRTLSNKTSLHKSGLDINDLVHDVVALLEVELTTNKILLREELKKDLPHVFGDRVQLQQVVMNVMVNAIEAMSDVEDRPRTLVIRSEQVGTDRLQVSVRDCGCGFDRRQAESLFETFFTTKPEGIGMGLSISRTIIETHGGTLGAEANDDHGATFTFVLPIDGEKS